MTTDTTSTVRFMNDNLANLSYVSRTSSSAASNFPLTNAFDQRRTKVFKFGGRFQITSTTNSIYINDGSNKTVTLTAGEYSTPALMATHIQTKLNASSSGFTVSYSSTTYSFTISRSSPFTMRFTQTANAAWTTLGFVSSTDILGSSFPAEEQRNHYPYEYILIDFGYDAQIDFFAMIGDVASDFGISNSATVVLEANNLNDFTLPGYTATLSVTDDGVFKFLTDSAMTAYRFWRIKITDIYNPLGNDGIQIGHLYLGSYTILNARNINRGFSHSLVDRSVTSESESGSLYSDLKSIYTEFENIQIGFLDTANKDILERLFYSAGKTRPFYISIDPTLAFSDTQEKMTKYVYFESKISFSHIFSTYFSCSFSLREAL